MSIALRVLLIIGCLFTFIYIQRKIKKSKFKIEESMFWIGFSVILLLLSIFPRIITFISSVIGVKSPVNCIFLIIIFLLILKVFQLSKTNSDLEDKLKQLAQSVAIDKKKKDTMEN